MVTSQNTATPPAATGIDLQVSALEPVSSTLTITVPLLPNSTQSSATLALSTATGSSCAAGTECASYSILMPAAAPYVGAFAATGTTLTQSTLAPAYTIDGIAFVPSSGGVADCSPNELKSTPVTPVARSTTPVSALAFTGCQ
jgi:cytochrome c5